MRIHFFDYYIATEYGIPCAMLLGYIEHWVEKNKANEKHFHDGHYWTYNSLDALKKMFPELTEYQIRSSLTKLEKEGLIITGNFNNSSYDRTKWYTLTKKGYKFFDSSICDYDKIHLSKTANGICENIRPIPIIKPLIDQKEKDIYSPESENQKQAEQIISYLNMKTGKHFRANISKNQKLIKARLREGFTIDDFKTVIDKKVSEWTGTEWQKYLRPETLFGTKFDGYLNQDDGKINPMEIAKAMDYYEGVTSEQDGNCVNAEKGSSALPNIQQIK